MGEIDRVRPTLSFTQLRNASQYQVGERKKHRHSDQEGQRDEPQDRVELNQEEPPEVETASPGMEVGEDGHIDVAA